MNSITRQLPRLNMYRPLMSTVVLLLLALPLSPAIATEDPWEAVNRKVFAFNTAVDNAVLQPVARGYRAVTPEPVRRGFGNVFGNLRDISGSLNALLQGRLGDAASNTGRVLLNTTVGLGGLLDVASELGVERRYADFGQTLAAWGVPSGPFVMVPLLGPSTIRAGSGLAVDTLALSLPPHVASDEFRLAIWGSGIVHTRASLLDTQQLISGDDYIFLREAYLQQRGAIDGDAPALPDFGSFDEGFDLGAL